MATAIQRTAVVIAGSGVCFSSMYMTYHYLKMEENFAKKQKEFPENFSFVNNPQRNEQYQQVANIYDDAIGKDEFYTGINVLRRALLRFHCQGSTILEVGAGTGRNIPYYPYNVKRVVLTDASEQMLEQAKLKANKNKNDKQFAFLTGDASKLPLPDKSFDTVIDTFGLCSYDDPVAVLNEMARLCKDDGKLLFLEHGRSHSWDFVSRHLDKHADQHAANWGCVWNRNLDELLEQASDIEIETLYKFHFGTTYYIVGRPKRH